MGRFAKINQDWTGEYCTSLIALTAVKWTATPDMICKPPCLLVFFSIPQIQIATAQFGDVRGRHLRKGRGGVTLRMAISHHPSLASWLVDTLPRGRIRWSILQWSCGGVLGCRVPLPWWALREHRPPAAPSLCHTCVLSLGIVILSANSSNVTYPCWYLITLVHKP